MGAFLGVMAAVRGQVRRLDLLAACCALFAVVDLLTDHDAANAALYVIYYIAVALFAASLTAGEAGRLVRSPVLWAALAFLLFHGLTPLWTGGMPRGDWLWLGVMLLEAFSASVIVAVVLMRFGPVVRATPLVLALVAGGTALFSIIRFFIEHGGPAPGLRLLTFPWPNENTGPAIFGLLVAGLVFWQRRLSSRALRAVVLLTCALMVADIALASTRAALVALLAVAFAYFLWAGPGRLAWRLGLTLAALVAGLVTVLVLVYGFGKPFTLLRDFGMRDQLWSGFWAIARETFWGGRGIQNQFTFSVAGINAPHNQMITMVLYGGVGLAALYLALYATMAWVALRHVLSGGSFAMAAIIVYLLVHGLFETVVIASVPGWGWLYIWVPIGLAAGLERRAACGPERAA